MTSVSNKDVRPTTLLVYDASKFAGVVVPWRFGLTTETLDSAKRRVL